MLINRIYSYLALAGGFIVALLFAIFTIRKGGRDAERAKNTETTLENVATAKQVQDDVSGMSVDNKRDELFTDWRK